MRLQVSVKTQHKTQPETGTISTLNLIVAPTDTVTSVKQRITAIEPTPFPDQELVFGGKVLGGGEKLSDCGVKEGSSLDFVVQTSEEALAQQLSELLQARALPPDELGLLYSHKHGATVGEALRVLGRAGQQLQDFLRGQKRFNLENGCVAAARGGTDVKQGNEGLARIPEEDLAPRFTVRVSVSVKTASTSGTATVLDLSVSPDDTVSSVVARIAAAELIPWSDQELSIDGRVLDGERNLSECSVKEGSSLDFVARASEETLAQQLAELLQARALPPKELGLLYCSRYGVSTAQALKTLGWGEKLPDFLERQGRFSVEGGLVALAGSGGAPKPGLGAAQPGMSQNERYLDLHSQICHCGIQEKALRVLDRVLEAVSEGTFLSVHRIVKGGSILRGTAIEGAVDIGALVFLNGLPPVGQDKWLPGLLKSAAAGLEACLSGLPGIEGVRSTDSAVQVLNEGSVVVDLRFSPVFGSYRDTLRAMAAQDPQVRRHCAAALMEHGGRFIERQPEAVKVTMRLLKWWRGRRQWSSAVTRPSDQLLELTAAYVAGQSKPRDQETAVADALSLLAKFRELRITWPGALCCYSSDDVPEALLQQRPLIMGPADPFANIADPQAFDPRELVAHAQSTGFFE